MAKSKTQIIRLMDIQDVLVKNGNVKDLEKLHKGYVYAAQKHRGQLRQSGEPYLSHPLHVAHILAEMNMDIDTVVSGLLHDTVEDTDATVEELTELFGPDVAFIVDGVTKIGKIEFASKEEKFAENFRKMLVSMSKDVRVIIIKLVDRLHNMRTLDALRQDKKERIARETMEIFAPLAHRLGIAWIKWELEDMAFRILEPEAYYDIYQKVKLKRTEREQYLAEVQTEVEELLTAESIPYQVFGRPKHFYSIYTKMKTKKTSFEEIYDLLALRILVQTVPQCYHVMGLIHNRWKPLPGRIKDYISMPKANNYQSLHTSVIGPGGLSVEFQIRTLDMHRIAEEGIAAHWKYKEGKAFDPKEGKEFVWLRQLLEQKELNRPTDFVDALKEDILPNQIYVFTPRGDAIELPVDSTPIDFAYAIHSEVGNRCTGAKVDGRMVPLRYRLKNGDRVDIVTSPIQEPRKDWLSFVKTHRAKMRIRAYLRKKEMDRAFDTGKDLLEKELTSRGHTLKAVLSDDHAVRKVLERIGMKEFDAVIQAIGFGRETARHVVNYFYPEQKDDKPDIVTGARSYRAKTEPILIDGVDGVVTKIARCCNPLPGDPIIGFISRGRGIVVHRKDCPSLHASILHEDRTVPVEWGGKLDYRVNVTIQTETEDRMGMINSLTTVVKDLDLNIVEMSARPHTPGFARQRFTVEVRHRDEVQHLVNRFRVVKGVREVTVLG